MAIVLFSLSVITRRDTQKPLPCPVQGAGGCLWSCGIPDEIILDQGTNFISAVLEELYRLLQVKQIQTSPYHPQTDGLVERFNVTLKKMLRKFVSRNQKDWDRLEEITELVKTNLLQSTAEAEGCLWQRSKTKEL